MQIIDCQTVLYEFLGLAFLGIRVCHFLMTGFSFTKQVIM